MVVRMMQIRDVLVVVHERLVTVPVRVTRRHLPAVHMVVLVVGVVVTVRVHMFEGGMLMHVPVP
jgi:hypothetical protein